MDLLKMLDVECLMFVAIEIIINFNKKTHERKPN